MQTWTFIDKANWPVGTWQEEPDKAQWQDAATGLPCLAVRHPESGHWCGYVGVAEGHPLFGATYSACPRDCGQSYCEHSPESVLNVHGGITYSDYCREEDQPHGVRHIPEPGQPDHVYWFGFDCAHGGDMSPRWDALRSYGRYRDLVYIQSECALLAEQLFSFAK